jgi:hypothetical protein
MVYLTIIPKWKPQAKHVGLKPGWRDGKSGFSREAVTYVTAGGQTVPLG